MPMTHTEEKLAVAQQAFREGMEALRRKRLAWMNKVVGRIEQEKISALRASLKS